MRRSRECPLPELLYQWIGSEQRCETDFPLPITRNGISDECVGVTLERVSNTSRSLKASERSCEEKSLFICQFYPSIGNKAIADFPAIAPASTTPTNFSTAKSTDAFNGASTNNRLFKGVVGGSMAFVGLLIMITIGLILINEQNKKYEDVRIG